MPRKKKDKATEIQPPAGATSEISEPPAGWTRYFDPGAARTYLYCDETGEWFFETAPTPQPALPELEEDQDYGPSDAAQVPIFGVLLGERPSAPPVPATGLIAADDPTQDSAVHDLAKVDPIVQDLLKDQLKLKKKLREIDALEIASRQKNLDPRQLEKLSSKQNVISDLRLVQDHIAEALKEWRRSRRLPVEVSDPPRVVSPKAKAKQSQPVQQGVNPLPQRGKAPLPVNPRIADMKLGNSASRHPTLAGYAASESQRSQPHVEVAGQSAQRTSAQSAPKSGAAQMSQVPQARPTLGAPIPAIDEDGFVAVRKGAKPKKAAQSNRKPGDEMKGDPSAPAPPEEDAFW